MNPMFWVLVIILCVVAWFLIAPVFQLVGGRALKIFDTAKRELTVLPQEGEIEDAG